MLAFSEIIDAAEGLLRKRFPGETYYRGRMPAEFARPCFLTELGTTEIADADCACLDIQATVKISAFAPSGEDGGEDASELMRRLAAVQELFTAEGLRLGDRVLRTLSNKGNCQPDHAEVAVTFQYMDDRPADVRQWPLMADVEISTRAK